MLRFKPTVRIGYFDTRLGDVFTAASIWSLRTGIDVEINSVEDDAPGRSPASLHPFGLAVDLDTAGDARRDLERLHAWLVRTLPNGYDVVLERDHVHVEWDAHRRALPAAGN